MLTLNKRIPQGKGLAPVLIKRAAQVELDWDTRQKSRFSATDSQGRALGVFLPRGTVVRGGDVLVAEDGTLIRVLAAPQAVLRITACSAHGSPFDLTRAAYHLGNRHVPIELRPDHLKIEPDHVLADLLRSMHLTVTDTAEAFEPEGGAYGDHATLGHAHHGDHGHDHGHTGHQHGHDGQCTHAHHGHDHGHGHIHGPGCAHDHAAPAHLAGPIGVLAPPADDTNDAPASPGATQPEHHGHGQAHSHAAHGPGACCGHEH